MLRYFIPYCIFVALLMSFANRNYYSLSSFGSSSAKANKAANHYHK